MIAHSGTEAHRCYLTRKGRLVLLAKCQLTTSVTSCDQPDQRSTRSRAAGCRREQHAGQVEPY
jgi:hypothetical protein